MGTKVQASSHPILSSPAAQLPPLNHGPPRTSPPATLDNDLAWRESLFEDESNYTVYLTERDVTEVKHALAHFKKLGIHTHQISRQSFPLPELGVRLRDCANEVHDGRGFVVLRGLDSTQTSAEDNVAIFLGVSSYIAETRGRQDHHGNMILHLQNSKLMSAAQHARPARDSNTGLQFHTDLWTDVLAMQVISNAAKGGRHILSSAYNVYNHLSAHRPDLLHLLMQPIWTFDPHSLHHTPTPRPLIHHHANRILFNFGRLHVLGDVDMPKLDLHPAQLEAFHALQSTAEKFQLRLDSQPGDLVFVNNLAVLHSREAFEDSPAQARHLVRLWLKNRALAWALPRILQEGNDKVFEGDGEDERVWEVVPRGRAFFELRDKFTP